MAGIDLTVWVTVAGTWVLVVGTLAFAYWQMRQNQRLHSTSTLLDLRERFYSPRLRQARRELSAWLLKPGRSGEPGSWEVVLFFEFVGFLTRSGTLERDFVRKSFGTWITGYYSLLTHPVDLLARWRTESNDPLIFADFEWMARFIIEMERRETPGSTFEASLLEEARDVLEGDARLETPDDR